VKILVQNCLNHLYLKGVGDWTAEPADAHTFASSEEAILFCSEHQIPAVQVVLKFDEKRYDIQVPLSEECEK
jgi:hypothetical protein